MMLQVKEYEDLLFECDRLAIEREKDPKKAQKSVNECDGTFLMELIYRKYPSIQVCADASLMDRSTLSRIVHKKQTPTPRQMIQITKALGFTDSREVFPDANI